MVSADSGEGEIDFTSGRRCKEFSGHFYCTTWCLGINPAVCTRPLHRKQWNITEKNV